jgi:tetratricopeptide (TPR) repeat protein
MSSRPPTTPKAPTKRAKGDKQPNFKICPACQTRNKAKWDICARCGESLEDVAPGMPPGMESAAVAPPPDTGSTAMAWITGLVAIVAAVAVFKYIGPLGADRPSPDVFTMPSLPPSPAPVPPATPAPDDEANRLFVQGRNALTARRFDDAVGLLRQAVGMASDRFDYRIAYARALMGTRAYDQALGEYSAALSMRQDVEALSEYGEAAAEAGRPAEAVEAWNRAVALDPRHLNTRRRLADHYDKAGKFSEAADHTRAIWEQQQNDPVLTQELAQAYEKAGRRDDAIATYQAVLSQIPSATVTRGLLAESLLNAGRGDDALKVFREGIELDPGSAILHRGLGSMQERTGHPLDAVASYRKYAELNPKASDASAIRERADRLEKQHGSGSAQSSPPAATAQRLDAPA